MARAIQTAETQLFSTFSVGGIFVAETAAVAIGGRSVALVASESFVSQLLAAEVLDDGTLATRVLTDLAGAPIPTDKVEALDALSLGDRAFVLTVDVSHAATLFELSEDLTLTAVDAADLSDETISTASDLFAAHGTLFLAFDRLFTNDVVIARVDPDTGFAGLPDPVILSRDDIGGGNLSDIASLSVGPRSFLYVGTVDGIAVAEVARDGSVAIISSDVATPGRVRDMVTAEVEGRSFLIVGGNDLRSYRVEADGSLTLVQSLAQRAFSVALAEEDGRTFVLVEDRLLELGGNGLLLDLGAVQDRAEPNADGDFNASVGLSGPNGATFVEFTEDVGFDQTDEVFATRVEVLTGPDLVIDPDAPLTLAEGVRVSLGGTVTLQAIAARNDGDEAAESYGISVFASPDAVLGTEAELIAGVAIARTEAGEAIGDVSGTVDSLFGAIGDAFVHVVVDSLGEVAETSEENNVATLRVQVTPFTGGDDVVTLPGASAFQWKALGGDDQVTGSDGRDRIAGGGGDDTISGERFSDTLIGGTGRDELRGGGGQDDLRGARGADALFGDGGKDRLDGGGASDALRGGGGRDVFVLGTGGRDRILDFSRQDRVEIARGAERFAELELTQRGDDVILQGDGLFARFEDAELSLLTAQRFDFV